MGDNDTPKDKGRKKFQSQKYFLGILVFILLLNGCAKHYTSATVLESYGFFSGVWHGFIFPFSLLAKIISWIMALFDVSVFKDVCIIGRPNTGFSFYYIGFILGLSALGGGSSRSN